jgi:molecular chaperone DnaK
VEAKNQADSLIHATEKALSEHGDKVDAQIKGSIETAIASLKEAIKGDDAEDIKAKTNTLAQASAKLGEAMYKAQQAEGGAGAESGEAPKPDDNVVDADFEEVDEDKKGAA